MLGQSMKEYDMSEESNLYPLWVGHYLFMPYTKQGRDRSGIDDWGLCRLIIAEQYGIAVPSMYNETDHAKFMHVLRSDNYQYYGHLLVAIQPAPKSYLFGIKLPGKRMLTCFKSGSCLARYEQDLLGGKDTWA